MRPAIRAESLSKRYRLGAGRAGDNLTEAVRAAAGRAWRRLARRPAVAGGAGEFWALKDVSLDIAQGHIVGIVGRNGAGKSTLLKVLTRIVEPTGGRAEVRGRVGSLLEVGTGFHPELSGRENVYLNGSVLGMTRREIARKFDEIVAFSEVERFLDTPVKRYSSGMYVRLAFAVAAHLEPEILIVDEVLAVGDAAFQRRCLGKMGEVARGGRTVLLVSHNMAAVRGLCNRAVLLDGGKVVKAGAPGEVLDAYLGSGAGPGDSAVYDLSAHPRKPGKEPIVRAVRLYGRGPDPRRVILCGDPLAVEFDLAFPRPASTPQVGIGVDDIYGQRVFSVGSFLAADDLPPLAGACTVRCRVPAVDLVPGRYTLSLSVGYSLAEHADQVEGVVSFDVEGGDFYGNGRLPTPDLGAVLVRSDWSARPAGGSP